MVWEGSNNQKDSVIIINEREKVLLTASSTTPYGSKP